VQESKTDHYRTLGLDRGCTRAQIDAAYRLLAKRHHPDVNSGSAKAATITRALNEAHAVLSDPVRRCAYDRELHAREKQTRTSRIGRIERNISQDVNLRIEDFFRGTSLEVQVRDPGNANSAEIHPVLVPPETAPGTRLRIPRAAPFEGGFVILRLRPLPSRGFKARGSDLKCELRINARLATQGGTETIPAATGKMLRLSVPAGVRRGETLRIAGEGLPRSRGGRGDLLVRISYRPEVRVTRR
jgi:DnaJ-class molecular chaperone